MALVAWSSDWRAAHRSGSGGAGASRVRPEGGHHEAGDAVPVELGGANAGSEGNLEALAAGAPPSGSAKALAKAAAVADDDVSEGGRRRRPSESSPRSILSNIPSLSNLFGLSPGW